MNTPRINHVATMLKDGKVLITGGDLIIGASNVGEKKAEIFDPNTNKFTIVGKISFSISGHTATLLNDGRVLIVGGSRFRMIDNEYAEIFDPKTNKFYFTRNTLTKRGEHTATLLKDCRVLITGGGNYRGNLKNSVLYDYPNKELK